jgi:hypothetical protein
MPEFAPLRSLPELDALDDDEVMAGYFAGFSGEPEPLASTVSRSLWHGWRNGAVDGGHRPKDADQALLAHAVVLGHGASGRACPVADLLQGFPIQ